MPGKMSAPLVTPSGVTYAQAWQLGGEALKDWTAALLEGAFTILVSRSS